MLNTTVSHASEVADAIPALLVLLAAPVVTLIFCGIWLLANPARGLGKERK
ncbi:hypothetical protein [Sutterella sp.]|uniref:hypothetical protein n=1 Tax=Sutterella sp. TaxID=1981025 RepID=UPI0026DEFD3A|nr:hypothetical protein [Sutterella sp.]MDO5530765.1 hypothetical protein [Sutterella sp.]